METIIIANRFGPSRARWLHVLHGRINVDRGAEFSGCCFDDCTFVIAPDVVEPVFSDCYFENCTVAEMSPSQSVMRLDQLSRHSRLDSGMPGALSSELQTENGNRLSGH